MGFQLGLALTSLFLTSPNYHYNYYQITSKDNYFSLFVYDGTFNYFT